MKEARSNQGGQNEDSNNKQDTYFLILRPREEKIDFIGLNKIMKQKRKFNQRLPSKKE
jgi:hypothetical protein